MSRSGLISPSLSLRSSAVALALVAAISACSSPDPAPSPITGSEALEPRYWAFQLQLHGSLSEGAGSMAGHSAAARSLGTVDGLWWTDHDWRIARHTYLDGFDFEALEQRQVIPHRGTPWAKRPRRIRFGLERGQRGPKAAASRWGLTTQAYEGQRALELALTGGPSAPDATSEQPSALNATLVASGSRFSASLAAQVELGLAMALDELTTGTEALVRLELSYQPDGEDHVPTELRYQLYREDAPPDRTAPHWLQEGALRVAVLPRPVTGDGRWQRLTLAVSADVEAISSGALALETSSTPEPAPAPAPAVEGEFRRTEGAAAAGFDLGGLDNSLRSIRFELRALGDATAAARFDALEIRCGASPDEVLTWQRQHADTLERSSGLIQHVGLEISFGDHLNAWLPHAELPDFDTHPHGLTPKEAVTWARQNGGLVSYNHIFGADDDVSADQAEDQRFRGQRVIQEHNFGAPILEVGYPLRVFPLEEHLAVWDALSLQGVRTVATGASDSHIQTEGWLDGNNYVTWIWATDASAESLLEGLASGRAFFGDPALFRSGRLDLTADTGDSMGSMVVTEQPRHSVRLDAPSLPPEASVRFIVDGESQPAPSPRRGEPYQANLEVDTRQPTFVRAEVWIEDRGIAFTNALYFHPP